MTPEQAAAYVFAQSICAFGELLALGPLPPDVKATEVDAILLRYGVHHNAVLQTFQDANR